MTDLQKLQAEIERLEGELESGLVLQKDDVRLAAAYVDGDFELWITTPEGTEGPIRLLELLRKKGVRKW